MTYEFIKAATAEGIATLTLNRPDKRNAMHGPLIAECLQALRKFAADDSRVLVINGSGENFCAGGDIGWMQKIATTSDDENYADAQSLADLLFTLYHFPKPTIVLAHGATMGGGLGLLSAADIAIAAKSATFSLPEVRIGITPSMISPYVIAAIGEREAHYYFMTGDRFGVDEARRLGLIHQIVENEALMSTGVTLAQTLMASSPNALREVKHLIRSVSKEKITAALAQTTAEHLAEIRRSPEAQEGLKSFLEKRKPSWVG